MAISLEYDFYNPILADDEDEDESNTDSNLEDKLLFDNISKINLVTANEAMAEDPSDDHDLEILNTDMNTQTVTVEQWSIIRKLIQCTICSKQLKPPVAFCNSGHHICSECWIKVPFCTLCMGYKSNNRCILLENIISEIPSPFINKEAEGLAILNFEDKLLLDDISKIKIETENEAMHEDGHDFKILKTDLNTQTVTVEQWSIIRKLIQCTICSKQLKPPVAFCNSGHHICSECWIKVPFCTLCMGYKSNNRCILLENIISEIPSPFINKEAEGLAILNFEDKLLLDDISKIKIETENEAMHEDGHDFKILKTDLNTQTVTVEQWSIIRKLIQCTICSKQLKPPVAFCNSGHHICSECWIKVPFCTLCMGYKSNNRCILLENIISEIPSPFINKEAEGLAILNFEDKLLLDDISKIKIETENEAMHEDGHDFKILKTDLNHQTDPVKQWSNIWELIQCPICCKQVKSPVTLCISGHHICSECWKKVPSCSMCRREKSEFKCLLLENILLEIPYLCISELAGCPAILPSKDMDEHNKLCLFRKYKCPLKNCTDFVEFYDFPFHMYEIHMKSCSIIKIQTHELKVKKLTFRMKDNYLAYFCFEHTKEIIFFLHYKKENNRYYFWLSSICTYNKSSNERFELVLNDSNKSKGKSKNGEILAVDDASIFENDNYLEVTEEFFENLKSPKLTFQIKKDNLKKSFVKQEINLMKCSFT